MARVRRGRSEDVRMRKRRGEGYKGIEIPEEVREMEGLMGKVGSEQKGEDNIVLLFLSRCFYSI